MKSYSSDGTPGPWFVSMRPDQDEEGWTGPAVYDRVGGVFAVVDEEPETIACPFREADARLIAAAPDLLAATEALLAVLDTWPVSSEELEAVYRSAVAAVDRAKGRETK